MEVINNFFKKEPNLSFVTAKIQQNCTDTGNDNSEATRQRINCDFYTHSKPRVMPCTRLLKCFVLQHSIIKTKHLRSLVRGLVWSFKWAKIMGFKLSIMEGIGCNFTSFCCMYIDKIFVLIPKYSNNFKDWRENSSLWVAKPFSVNWPWSSCFFKDVHCSLPHAHTRGSKWIMSQIFECINTDFALWATNKPLQ